MRVVMFLSRNKDNMNIEGFTPRTKCFLYNDSPDMSAINASFTDFVNKGKKGELSRFYISVNKRDIVKTNKELTKYLIDNPEINTAKIENKAIEVTFSKSCKETRFWLFDVDFTEGIEEFFSYIKEYGHFNEVKELREMDNESIMIKKTVNGYAIITGHGFDIRELNAKFIGKDFDIKRDSYLCFDWKTKNE